MRGLLSLSIFPHFDKHLSNRKTFYESVSPPFKYVKYVHLIFT